MLSDQVSLGQLQRVARMADTVLSHDGVPDLINKYISVQCFFNFIEQYSHRAYILGNKQIQHEIRAGRMDIRHLNPIEVGLLAINDVDIDTREVSPEQVLTSAKLVSEGVTAEAKSYLQARSSPKTPEEFHEFTQLITALQKEGVSAIWHAIKDSVADRLLSDFVTLYYGDEDDYEPDSPWGVLFGEDVFTEAELMCKGAGTIEERVCANYREQIELGQQVVLGDLSAFQEQAQSSKGYAECLRRAISYRPTAVFFDIAEALYYHRHSSLKAQREHDKKCGLVVI